MGIYSVEEKLEEWRFGWFEHKKKDAWIFQCRGLRGWQFKKVRGRQKKYWGLGNLTGQNTTSAYQGHDLIKEIMEDIDILG